MDTVVRVLPQNEGHLRDDFGSRLLDGMCVVDPDNQIGHVRLAVGDGPRADSPTGTAGSVWTQTRDAHPLSGKVARGSMVRVAGWSS